MRLLALLCLAGCTTGSLDGDDARFSELISADAELTTLVKGFQWVEGPLWHPERRELLFSSIPDNAIFRWDPRAGSRRWLDRSGYSGTVPSIPEGVVISPDGRFIVATTMDGSNLAPGRFGYQAAADGAGRRIGEGVEALGWRASFDCVVATAPAAYAPSLPGSQTVKTTPEVAELAHELMLEDLIASETYLLYAVMMRDWGYDKLADHFEHESQHERQHATWQLDRLAYLEVPIDLTRRPTPPPTPTSAKGCLETSLAMENGVAEKLRRLCALSAPHDGGTHRLAERLLVETETDHILWLKQQLGHIERVGEAVYLAEMIRPDPSADPEA